MKMIKKLVSLVLVLLMTATMCTAAFAENVKDDDMLTVTVPYGIGQSTGIYKSSAKKTAIVFATGIGQTTSFKEKNKLVSDSNCISCVDIDCNDANAYDLAVAKAAEFGCANEAVLDAIKYAIYEKYKETNEDKLKYAKFDFADENGNVKAFAIKKGNVQKFDGICYVGADGSVHTTWNEKIYDFQNIAFTIEYSNNMLMLNTDIKALLKNVFLNIETCKSYKVISQLLESAITGKYTVKYDDIKDLGDKVFKDSMLDENFKLPANVFVPQYSVPISQYPSGVGSAHGKYGIERLYRDVPINSLMRNSIVDENGDIKTDADGKIVPITYNKELMDSVFCYSHAALGSVENWAQELKEQIDLIVDKENGYGFDDVVLVPMSMGATVVSQYLYDCKKQGIDSHVSKVVSVVGCWNGSSILPALFYKDYHIGDDEILYSRISELYGLGDLAYDKIVKDIIDDLNKKLKDGKSIVIDESTIDLSNDTLAALISFALRGLSHNGNLKLLVSDVLDYISDFILHTPSLLTLVSYEEYEKIERDFLQGDEFAGVRAQMQAYHEAQRSFAECTFTQDYQDVDFYFISGYGLGLGQGYAATNEDPLGNLSILKLLDATYKCNSDEIIDIESTCPGAKSVPVGTKFSDDYIANAKAAGTDKYIDPYSTSVDISGCPNPDNCWLFYKQYHQLNGNQTALNLALDLVQGNDISGYPRFNESKCVENEKFDLLDITDRLINKLRKGEITDKEDYEKCLGLISKSIELMNRNENNRADDDREMQMLFKKMSKFVYGAVQDRSKVEKIAIDIFNKILDTVNKLLGKINSGLYKQFGTKGLRDTLLGKAKDAYRTVLLKPVFDVIYKVLSVVEKFVK